MPVSEIAVILRWLIALWALGWLVLPLSSRLLPFLPDQGLAAGRVVAVVLVSLGAFWGASIHLVPLTFAPFLWIVAPLIASIGWRNQQHRAQILSKRRSLLASDLVFLACFGFLLWVRLRHPEANDFEKPMDMALLSSAMRTTWLPFENPWFAGAPFTNYYYFGPLMGAYWPALWLRHRFRLTTWFYRFSGPFSSRYYGRSEQPWDEECELASP